MNVRLESSSRLVLNGDYEYCAEWSNISNTPAMLQILATVARPDATGVVTASGYRLPLKVNQQRFCFDTGADMSIVSGALALDLGLKLQGKPIEVSLADGGVFLGVRTDFALLLGEDWLTLPCIVPHPPNRFRVTENILGMAHLLEAGLFVVSSKYLAFLRVKIASSASGSPE